MFGPLPLPSASAALLGDSALCVLSLSLSPARRFARLAGVTVSLCAFYSKMVKRHHTCYLSVHERFHLIQHAVEPGELCQLLLIEVLAVALSLLQCLNIAQQLVERT